jgi:GntR family galactonate operon transcriptional repressor
MDAMNREEQMGGTTQSDATKESPPRRPRVTPDITRALAGEILSGHFPPGATLPTENELGASYGVSRTVIREALKVLAAKGLVYSRPRIGTMVCEPDNWSLLDPQVMDWHGPTLFDRNLLEAVLETRRALEPLAASLAAERASLQELADLDAAWQRMAASSKDVDRFSVADVEFHRVLYRASHNPVIRQIGTLIDAALKYSFETSNKTVFDRDEAVIRHGAVVEALRMRDKEAAAAAALSLLDQAARDIDLAGRKTKN